MVTNGYAEQSLVDRGWRRSGKYCYKPIMDQTCCPQYTIRLDANKFSPSKAQRKLARKFRNFIVKGGKTAADETGDQVGTTDAQDAVNGSADLAGMEMAEAKSTAAAVLTSGAMVGEKRRRRGGASEAQEAQSPTEEPATVGGSPKTSATAAAVKPGVGADPKRPRAKKAKELRRARAAAKGKSFSRPPQVQSEQKSMAEILLEPYPEDCAHKLEIRYLPSHTDYPEFEAAFDEEFEVNPAKCHSGNNVQVPFFLVFRCTRNTRSRYPATRQGR